MLSTQQVTSFQQEILTWYAKNQRDLPWRKTRDPYAILVSEIMLQQTQVSRVIPKYKAWLAKWPTLLDLAQAKPAEVLALWSGLGYNRRALNLHKLAQQVTGIDSLNQVTLNAQLASQLPNTVEQLKKLPGLGEYTARAVACFGFDKQVAVVDTNIRKVIAIHFFDGTPPDPKTTQEIADQLLPVGKAYEWNQALMDYASAMLAKQKIPIPKQSKFTGSNRYYRGQTIKLLVKEGQATKQQLVELLNIEIDRVEKLITDLVRDKLVEVHDGILTLPA